MKLLKSPVVVACLLLILAIACVPGRQFEEVKTQRDQLLAEQEDLRASSKNALEGRKDMEVRIESLERRVKTLQEDTAMMGTSSRKLRVQYDKLLALNDQLLDKSDRARTGTESERQKLLIELDNVRTQLELKEDRLDKLDKELRDKAASLEEREAKIKELTDMIQEKDAALSSLKDKIAKALAGYEDKGLSVEQKNGRIYVNMEAKLLFASGSTAVGKEGKQAVIDLAKVIQDQPDLSITIEGHTDTDKVTSTSVPRDNWELSVLRATEVVKIMMDNSSIQPKMLTAAGRSEYIPVDPSDKSKNRRIEVVLTPNLDAVFELLE
jgi:chemotaxis protein MotB